MTTLLPLPWLQLAALVWDQNFTALHPSLTFSPFLLAFFLPMSTLVLLLNKSYISNNQAYFLSLLDLVLTPPASGNTYLLPGTLKYACLAHTLESLVKCLLKFTEFLLRKYGVVGRPSNRGVWVGVLLGREAGSCGCLGRRFVSTAE